MLMDDFVNKLLHKSDTNFIAKMYVLCADVDDIVDDKVFDKILLMINDNIPHETIYIVMQNSLDYRKRLDVRKFYDELGENTKKLQITPEQIKMDIAAYDKEIYNNNRKTMDLLEAFLKLKNSKIDEDFIFDEILRRIIDSKTKDLEIKQQRVNAAAVEAIIWMKNDGWSEEDIKKALKDQIDGTPNFDIEKFSHYIPKRFKKDNKRISKQDGSIKNDVKLQFLKNINVVMKFFNENSAKIMEISQKYRDDNIEFAKAFYDLYVQYRGWTPYEPKLIIKPNENSRTAGCFSPEGKVVLHGFSSQEYIINEIIHELTHFEQYLMCLNTNDVGILPYAKEFVMHSIVQAQKLFDNEDKERLVLDNDFYNKFKSKVKDMANMALDMAKSRLENDFYYNALKIPHKKITPESVEYKTVQKLADSLTTMYNHENRGNSRFVYPKLFTEQMAFAVGNASAGMFRNIISKSHPENITTRSGILEFESR